jgi:predicted nuclease of restriction endonuclease-like (RecB) superfamily
MSKIITASKKNLFQEIKQLLESAKSKVVQTVNTTMVLTYFEVGRLIVEDEQKGSKKAEYGKETLKNLSKQLVIEFGKGFSVQNLERMRLFYLIIEKSSTLSRKLSWSHYVRLISLKDAQERNFYEKECSENQWSIRELDRQINSALFERIVLSKDKKGVLADNLKKYHAPENPQDILKDPYILEFLKLDENTKYSENELEQAIIDNLQKFLLEFGKGFSFIARQKRFSFGSDHFYIDLVFYNRLLKSFVLIDLKINKLTHQDLGQMQMYVNMFDRLEKKAWENPTIGLILCKEKNEIVIEYTLPENSNIFAREYKLYLPSKIELKKQIQKAEKIFLNNQNKPQVKNDVKNN